MTEQGLKEVDKEEYLAKLNEMNKKKEEIEQQKNGIIINNSEQFSEFECHRRDIIDPAAPERK